MDKTFFRMVSRHILTDGMRCLVTWEELGVEQLLLSIRKSIYFGCLPFASLEKCSMHVTLEGGPGEGPGHAGKTVFGLAWESLSIPHNELEEMNVDDGSD